VTLAAGIGPFYYYDTTAAAYGHGYSDNHGLTYLYSLGATWRPTPGGVFLELRLDRTSPSKSIETTSLSAGIGYRLRPDTASGPGSDVDGAIHRNEVTLYYGKTVVNGLSSPESPAWAAEYRHAFTPTVRASLAFVNEGDARLIRRSGGILEGWLEPGFYSGRFTVGIGAGIYAAIDKYRPTFGRHLSGIVTMTTSYRFLDRVDARFDWHRIVTDYDRDTDIVLFGLGYRFRTAAM
jgi:hypothetical protein